MAQSLNEVTAGWGGSTLYVLTLPEQSDKNRNKENLSGNGPKLSIKGNEKNESVYSSLKSLCDRRF